VKLRYFEDAVNIGVGYFIKDNIRTTINIKPLNRELLFEAKEKTILILN
jgi:hypothetical protein